MEHQVDPFGPCPSDQFGGGGDSMPAGGEVTVPGKYKWNDSGAGNEAPPGWTPLNLNDPFADPGMGGQQIGDELPTGGGEFDGSIADNTMMPDCGGGSLGDGNTEEEFVFESEIEQKLKDCTDSGYLFDVNKSKCTSQKLASFECTRAAIFSKRF